MRALTVTPPQAIQISEFPEPTLADGDVVIKVRYAAVDGGDHQVAQGVYHELGYITRDTVGLGWDFVGTVTAAADGSGFAPGDLVAGVVDTFDKEVGSIAEVLAVPANAIARIPAGLDPEHAAIISMSALTAEQALALLGPARGSILITGAAGLVGGFALDLARDLGFTVTGLARSGDREFVEGRGARLIESLEGNFDAVFDAANLGAPALAVVRDGGAYVGVHPGSEPAAERDIAVSAVIMEADAARLRSILARAAAGELPARIAGVVSLNEAPATVAAGLAPGQRGRHIVRL
ncbi:NADP-dependent oxidoreductase [Mycetocola sp. JXN-3]|uniref:NADP-dependent oxidoreductase n=1 Tax=Mycetocola sp. JXN-3 TaxID=2116510 RepID=UPI00165CF2C3|nr:NADP-dependent oxidoreductase [Mycetocola sp. JXN-3]